MAHPVHLIKRYARDVEEGKYASIRRALEERDPFATAVGKPLNPEVVARHLHLQNAALIATKARLIDKINLIREMVASGTYLDEETLSDDDFLLVLAGWAVEMRGRFK
jgi:hypothetical protein